MKAKVFRLGTVFVKVSFLILLIILCENDFVPYKIHTEVFRYKGVFVTLSKPEGHGDCLSVKSVPTPPRPHPQVTCTVTRCQFRDLWGGGSWAPRRLPRGQGKGTEMSHRKTPSSAGRELPEATVSL